MLDLYRAAAEESDAVLQRGRSFDFERAQKYIEKGYIFYERILNFTLGVCHETA